MFSRRPYPSIELVLAQHGYGIPELMRLPHRRYHYPHSRAQSSRTYERSDPAMRTIDTRWEASTNGLMPTICKEPGDEALANLHQALHSNIDGGSRARRVSLTTVIIDLALVLRRKVQEVLLAQEKGDEDGAEIM